MAKYVSRELARGAARTPGYTPYRFPEVGEQSSPAPTAEHAAALARRRADHRQAAKSTRPQSVPLNAWVLYRIRFIFTADVCGAWPSFGGLSAQLNRLSIALHIATTERYPLLFPTTLSFSIAWGGSSVRAPNGLGRGGFRRPPSLEQRRYKIHALPQSDKPEASDKTKERKKRRAPGFLRRNT